MPTKGPIAQSGQREGTGGGKSRKDVSDREGEAGERSVARPDRAELGARTNKTGSQKVQTFRQLISAPMPSNGTHPSS